MKIIPKFFALIITLVMLLPLTACGIFNVVSQVEAEIEQPDDLIETATDFIEDTSEPEIDEADSTDIDPPASESDPLENTTPPPTDLPDGFHTYICDEYWSYEGHWENGLPNGAGTMTGKDGEQTEIYETNFVDGMMHGTVHYTVITNQPSQTMIWTFEANMGYSEEDIVTNSKGEELTAHTTVFGVPPWGHYRVGDIRNYETIPDGHGEYTHIGANGIEYHYIGEWKNGNPNGQGIIYVTWQPSADNAIHYTTWVLEGNFVDGIMDGTMSATLSWSDGNSATFSIDFDMGAALQEVVYSDNREFWPSGTVFGMPPWNGQDWI
jgi:hypothetical protein